MLEAPRPFPTATWRAVLARLIPAEDAPGALEAGIDQRLHQQGHALTFAAWLDALDVVAGGQFPSLEFAAQDALLHQVEAGDYPTVSAAHFAELVSLTAEAFYTNPDDLAPNRTSPAWQMLGYTPRPSPPPAP